MARLLYDLLPDSRSSWIWKYFFMVDVLVILDFGFSAKKNTSVSVYYISNCWIYRANLGNENI